jgi:hypothetical protein
VEVRGMRNSGEGRDGACRGMRIGREGKKRTQAGLRVGVEWDRGECIDDVQGVGAGGEGGGGGHTREMSAGGVGMWRSGKGVSCMEGRDGKHQQDTQ